MTYDPTEAVDKAKTLAGAMCWARGYAERIATSEALRAHIRASVEAAYEAGRPKWQPIESAPRDGTHVHLYAPELQFVGFCAGSGNWCYVAPSCPFAPSQPTHWKPLPAAPQEQGQA